MQVAKRVSLIDRSIKNVVTDVFYSRIFTIIMPKEILFKILKKL